MLTQLKAPNLQDHKNSLLLQGVLESLVDGVIILTQQGEQVYINDTACQICQRINQDNSKSNDKNTRLPTEIWRICQTLMQCLNQRPEQIAVVESELVLTKSSTYRVRVRWLSLEHIEQPCLLVLVEDCYQSIQNRAIAEAKRYGLTPRQVEVWLLRHLGYTQQEIAKELYITRNTVKKHIQCISFRQQEVLTLEELAS